MTKIDPSLSLFHMLPDRNQQLKCVVGTFKENVENSQKSCQPHPLPPGPHHFSNNHHV